MPIEQGEDQKRTCENETDTIMKYDIHKLNRIVHTYTWVTQFQESERLATQQYELSQGSEELGYSNALRYMEPFVPVALGVAVHVLCVLSYEEFVVSIVKFTFKYKLFYKSVGKELNLHKGVLVR